MTHEELLSYVDYRDGALYWKITTSNRVKIGDQVGSIQPNGYLGTRINNIFYLVHRLIYIYHNKVIPDNTVIDHKDRNKLNNCITNLRCVTKQQNTFNCSNTKGFVKRGNYYTAKITLNNKVYIIGSYKTEEEATNAYTTVKPVLHVFAQTEPTEQQIKEKILEVRPKVPANNTSGVKGVHKRPNGTYQARIRTKDKAISLGHFKTLEEASLAITNYNASKLS